jgi:hypothetical protein
MFSSHSLPETQAALALSIFFATFIYEDGATLLAATLIRRRKLGPADRTPYHLLRYLGRRHGIVRAGLQFRAAHGAVALAAEILKARVTR